MLAMMPKFMISCRKASELSSEGFDRPLSFGERFSLRLHTTICSACKLFEKQIRGIRASVRCGEAEDIGLGDEHLSPEAKERICRKVTEGIS